MNVKRRVMMMYTEEDVSVCRCFVWRSELRGWLCLSTATAGQPLVAVVVWARDLTQCCGAEPLPQACRFHRDAIPPHHQNSHSGLPVSARNLPSSTTKATWQPPHSNIITSIRHIHSRCRITTSGDFPTPLVKLASRHHRSHGDHNR